MKRLQIEPLVISTLGLGRGRRLQADGVNIKNSSQRIRPIKRIRVGLEESAKSLWGW